LVQQLLGGFRLLVDDVLGQVDVELDVLALEQALQQGLVVQDVFAGVLL